MRYLTKSRFKLAQECPTKLFYTGKKDQYEDKSLDDPFLKALASGGFQVGELAKIYHPGGHMIDTLDYDEACQQTEALLKEDEVVIYEAALRYESLFVRVDVLVKKKNTIQLIEVKSKSFDPTTEDPFYDKRSLKKGIKKIKSEWLPYLDDIAFQTYVAKKSMPLMTLTSYLMLSDKSKVSSIDGLNQKFLLVENEKGRTSAEIKKGTNLNNVGDKILCRVPVSEAVDVILQGTPDVSYQSLVKYYADAYSTDKKIISPVGQNCKKCQFKSDDPSRSGFYQCWKETTKLPEKDLNGPFVFDVWNFRKAKSLLEDGVYLMRDIEEDDVKIKEADRSGLSSSQRQWVQIESVKNNHEQPYIDYSGLAHEMAAFKFPLHFIDFETTMVAIPFNKGRRAYEQIAFQFSHHQVDKNGAIVHKGQYINTEVGKFPNFDFVRALKSELENDEGTIFRYSNHENTVLCQIYDQLSDSHEQDKDELQDWIRSITTKKEVWNSERTMIDMCEIVKFYYYHPFTGGSNSIKKVLPATLLDSHLIKEKYAHPIYGNANGIPSLNYQDWTWVQYDEKGNVKDPYKLLPSVFEGVDVEKLDRLMGTDELADGGAAMMAYAKMQFTEMSKLERDLICNALLKYCELDTFAMVLLYEYWVEVISNHHQKVA